MKKRDAKIAKRVRRGEPVAAVAARYEITPRRVTQIAGPATTERRGRKPTGAATHNTARGRALLAQLVADAGVLGLEPEDYLAAARARSATPPPAG